MPLEVFVHGALCMSYSGQCLASEALWGRSANRGMCGQACRLPYRLKVDGRPRNLGEKAYLLSTKDLAAYDRLAELVRLGVAGFKIEGRLKSAHYVAAATQVYRAAIDAACDGRPFALSREAELGLVQSFSRGFTHGFLDGVSHQDLVHGLFPKSRGVRLGTVVAKAARGIVIELDREHAGSPPAAPRRRPVADPPRRAVVGRVFDAAGSPKSLGVQPGDGVAFDEGRPAEDEQGGRVFSVEPERGRNRVLLTFGEGVLNLAAVAIGCTVWKTDDPRLEREWEKSYARETVARRVPLVARVDARVGQPLRLRLVDPEGHEAEALSEQPLEKALRHPLTEDVLREQIGRLGDTPFKLVAVELSDERGRVSTADVMVPKSVLNDVRRRAVQSLMASLGRESQHAIAEPGALQAIRSEVAGLRPPGADAAAGPPRLYVLVRSPQQLDAVLGASPPRRRSAPPRRVFDVAGRADVAPGAGRPALIYCDYPDPYGYADAVARCRAAAVPVGLATFRIIKPGDEKCLGLIADARPDAVLVRNLAGLTFFREAAPGLPLVGDFSLNVANEITAGVLAEAGLARLTPALDLNLKQLAAMAGRLAPLWLEPIVHLHVPMMYMEHCAAAAHLSKGRDAAGCGRPCTRRTGQGAATASRLELVDRVGAEHPLIRTFSRRLSPCPRCSSSACGISASNSSAKAPSRPRPSLASTPTSWPAGLTRPTRSRNLNRLPRRA